MLYGLTNSCETKKLRATVPVEEFLHTYVDVPRFLECCRVCPNYSARWSCPPYDFDPEALWRRFSVLEIRAMQVLPRTEEAKRAAAGDAAEFLRPFADAIDGGLAVMEQNHPGALALHAGKCHLCRQCARTEGKPCRMPEKMRYSIEALGGNVALVADKLLNVPLVWGKAGEAAEYYVMVGGLLLPADGHA